MMQLFECYKLTSQPSQTNLEPLSNWETEVFGQDQMCLTNKPLHIALDLTMTNLRLYTHQKHKYKLYPFEMLRRVKRKNK